MTVWSLGCIAAAPARTRRAAIRLPPDATSCADSGAPTGSPCVEGSTAGCRRRVQLRGGVVGTNIR